MEKAAGLFDPPTQEEGTHYRRPDRTDNIMQRSGSATPIEMLHRLVGLPGFVKNFHRS